MGLPRALTAVLCCNLLYLLLWATHHAILMHPHATFIQMIQRVSGRLATYTTPSLRELGEVASHCPAMYTPLSLAPASCKCTRLIATNLEAGQDTFHLSLGPRCHV